MSSYLKYNNEIAFHPGYYLKEIVDDSGLTQEDFARRLGTTPKNLSVLLKGEQSLSIDVAAKLSRMLGTTVKFWLNLQQAYDEKAAEFLSQEELKREREVFRLIDYDYFKRNYGMPELAGMADEQIKCVREFLAVSSLTVLEEENLAVSFRKYSDKLSRSGIINANVMAQIAVNQALRMDIPRFNKRKFARTAKSVLPLITKAEKSYQKIRDTLSEAGVAMVVLPDLKDSEINGATKKVDGKVLMMVSDYEEYTETFWDTIISEINSIADGDLGITVKDDLMADSLISEWNSIKQEYLETMPFV